MSAIRELIEKADRGDVAGVEEGLLEWIGGGSFHEGCGQEIVDLAAKVIEAGRKSLAPTILNLSYPEIPAAEGVPVLKRLIRLAPDTPGLATELVTRVQEAFASDPDVRAALRASELDKDENVKKALDRFESFCTVRVGVYVQHRGDWGTGRVREIDPLTGSVIVDFQHRPGHQMTLEGVVELLEFLDGEGWPARKFDRMEELQEMAEKEPAALLRLALVHFGGRTDLPSLRNELRGSVVPANRWSRWWNAAKRAALKDPGLEVKTGGGSTTIEEREEALEPADEVRDALAGISSLTDRWKIATKALRDFSASEEVVAVIRPSLIEAIETGWEAAHEESPETVVECLVFLESTGWQDSAVYLHQIAETADGDLLSGLSAKDDQRRFLQAIVERSPEGGVDALFSAFLADSTKIRGEIRQALADRPELVAEIEGLILEDPAEHRESFLELIGGGWELAGPFEEADLVRAAARFGHDVARDKDLNKTTLDRFIKRCREYLEADRHVRLRTYIQDRSKDEVSRLASYLRRTEPLEDLYYNILRLDLQKKLPEEFVVEVKRFWDTDDLFSTLEGIERRRKEYRHLIDVEMPEIERRIGEAQSMGDLSENAEWAAAIEKRNELADKIKEMREEFERVRAIEEEDVPVDVVAPGTRVLLRNPDSDEEATYEVLGPWDVDVEHGILSYLSPVAAGLLGKKVGEEAVIELPGRQYRYMIEAIEHFLTPVGESESAPS